MHKRVFKIMVNNCSTELSKTQIFKFKIKVKMVQRKNTIFNFIFLNLLCKIRNLT